MVPDRDREDGGTGGYGSAIHARKILGSGNASAKVIGTTAGEGKKERVGCRGERGCCNSERDCVLVLSTEL